VALLRTVTDGFAAIKPREWKAIDDKWFGSTIDKYGSYLTYAGYAAIAAMLLVAGLAGWNHMLRTRVLERTSALRDAASELEALSRRLVELQEFERKELARELHDRVGQSLTALNINLNIIGSALPSQASDELRARLADSEALLESTTAVIGNVMAELHPPMLDDQGLMLALEWYARQFSARTGISVTVRGLDSSQRPAPKMEIALFRIAQEALNNVAKHAEAGQVEITLSRVDREYVMTVQDDGIGFDAAEERAGRRPALGMITMRERSLAVGGRLEVRTLARGGARVTVRVPS
jgi:two-component system sensor histidine kinase UhpB